MHFLPCLESLTHGVESALCPLGRFQAEERKAWDQQLGLVGPDGEWQGTPCAQGLWEALSSAEFGLGVHVC